MKVSNWNGRPVVENATLTPFEKGKKTPVSFCPRGSGNSYGDISLQTNIIDCTGNRKTLELENDILTASAGFTIADILNFSIPKGYILPVIPGTQHPTVGGMIAADVHGKNHVTHGAIGKWIESMEIQNQQGEITVCSPTENTELYEMTIGGLGLTGIIISAKFKLIPLKTTTFEQRTTKFPSLNAMLSALDESTAEHKTCWFDFLRMDNFLLLENNQKPNTEIPENFQLRKPKIKVPFRTFPFVQPSLMKIYNKRFAKKSLNAKNDIRIDDALFPLNSITNWNYLYGDRGFYQLQFSLPKEGMKEKIEAIHLKISTSKYRPVLAVVKKHGDIKSSGTLSFVQPGFSFAYDFVYKKGLTDFLRGLNREIADLGGRVYLAKDALLDARSFEKMYPEAQDFKSRLSNYNDGSIQSLLSNRLNLTTSMNQRFLIIGANSDIAQACIPHFEKGGAQLILGSHKPDELQSGSHEIVEIDVTRPEDAIQKIESLQFDGVVYAAGSLPENEEALFGDIADHTMTVNYTGAVRILGAISKKFIDQKKGTIVGISSAGAVRGKTSNIVYGSAKGGFDHYLGGLRQYLHPKGIRVVTIRPGFVATKMTKGLDLPEKLTAAPDQVAKTIVKHALKGNRNIVYAKPIWRPISWIIRNIPEPIFKRKQL